MQGGNALRDRDVELSDSLIDHGSSGEIPGR